MSEPRRPHALDAGPALRRAAAVGLPGVGDQSPLCVTLDDVSEAVRHRVQGLLSLALECGSLDADDVVRHAAREAHLGALRNCLMVEDSAVRVVELLGAHAVDHRVLKGVALAHLDYQDPSERVFADVDVLVRREDHRRALDALAEGGFRRLDPPVRPGWERRFGKAVVLAAPGQSQLDLHLAITGGYFGLRIPHQELWDEPPGLFRLAGREVKALGRGHRFLHVCCHSILGGGSGLRAVRDVAELALTSGPEIHSTLDQACRWGVDQVVVDAVRVAWRTLSLDEAHAIHRWAIEHPDDPEQRRYLRGYTAALEGGWGPEGMTALGALGVVDRIRFLSGLLLPSSASLRHRGRSRTSHLAHITRTLLRR